MAQNVKVCCRFRPFSQSELGGGVETAHTLKGNVVTLVSRDPSIPAPNLAFDECFDVDASQEAVFTHSAGELVGEVMKGYNVTVFAYGQTGSGKTFTMMGDPRDEVQKGVIPRLVEGVFESIAASADNIEYTVSMTYVEIYNEMIRDLLDPSKTDLPIRERNQAVYIQGATEVYVGDVDTVLETITHGSSNRAVASHAMNAQSSRSHSVFFLTLEMKDTATGSKRSSKLILVDLAGSEKVRKTNATGSVLEEAKAINKSLSTLGNVINALTSGREHVPYRDSKLTRLLCNSLGGNSKTCLIVTASPALYNLTETTATLRFGVRAKSIQNKATVNRERSAEEYKRLLAAAMKRIAELEAKCARLTQRLADNGIEVPADEAGAESAPEAESALATTALAEHVKELVRQLADKEGEFVEAQGAAATEIDALRASLREVYAAEEANADKASADAESIALLEAKVTRLSAEAGVQKLKMLEREQILLDQMEKIHVRNKTDETSREPDVVVVVDERQAALERKCEQLELAQKASKVQEEMLEATLKRAQDDAEKPLARIEDLEHQLAQAKGICKQLLDSGLYWRQNRRKPANTSRKIIVPIRGGTTPKLGARE